MAGCVLHKFKSLRMCPQQLVYVAGCVVHKSLRTLATVRNSCVPVDTLATVNSTFGCGHTGDCELNVSLCSGHAGDCDKSMFGSVDTLGHLKSMFRRLARG